MALAIPVALMAFLGDVPRPAQGHGVTDARLGRRYERAHRNAVPPCRGPEAPGSLMSGRSPARATARIVVRRCAGVHGSSLAPSRRMRCCASSPPASRPRAASSLLRSPTSTLTTRLMPRSPSSESRCVEEDFNRREMGRCRHAKWPARLTWLRRARALRPFYDTVDHLLDLHSMLEPAPRLRSRATPPKVWRWPTRWFAPHALVDSGHAAGKRLRNYAGFGASQPDRRC